MNQTNNLERLKTLEYSDVEIYFWAHVLHTLKTKWNMPTYMPIFLDISSQTVVKV